MQYLGLLDWAIIAVYLVGIILFGVWFGKNQKDVKDYFLGSRNIRWWGVGLSIIATETSALTFITIPALAYGGDLRFIQIVIGYVIARVIIAVFLVPAYFKGEIYSPYQLFASAYGAPARRAAAGLFLVSGTLAAGVRVYVTSIPIQLMLGIHIGWAIVLFVGLSLIYTYFGGIKAVVWTDVIQFAWFMLGGLFVLIYIPGLVPGGLEALWAQAAADGKLRWLDPEFALQLPPFNLWMGLIGATVLVMSSHGADQLIVQRVLTCKNVQDGRKAIILSAVIILPLFLLFLLAGTFLWFYYQHFEFQIPLPESRPGMKKDDYIFPIFILTVVPPGLRGFLIVAIISAAMSSVSSALSALASVMTMDVLKGSGKNASLGASRSATLLWGAMLVLVAVMSRRQTSILNLAFSLSGLTSGALLGGLILTLLRWRMGAAPVVAGMGISVATMIAVHSTGKIGWPWYTLIGASTTVVVAALWAQITNHPIKNRKS